MKTTKIGAMIAFAAAFLALVLPACAQGGKQAKSPARERGAEPGEWTQDYDAALALAKEKGLPILLAFSGSDWCPWCIMMEKKVFDTPAWKEWAKKRVAMAFIDFPNDKGLVPADYAERNSTLAAKYGVEGLPSYILFASDGEKSLGELGASRDATPEKFIAMVEALLKVGSPAEKQ